MKLDNLVIEELSRIKSLFDYQRGKVISEQEPTYDKAKYDAEDRQYYINQEFCSQVNGTIPERSVAGYYTIKAHTWAETVKTYKVTDAEIKAAQATCPEVKLQQANSTPKPPPQIPTELKDINGVKKFQDWLDTNKAGWASGYEDGKLNQTGNGYGRMGPRTNKAWGLYKDEYLNPTDKVEPITSQEITTINASLMKPGETSNDYFKNPDGTIKVNDLEPVTVSATRKTPTVVTKPNEVVTAEKPTEPGQTGEYKNGWYWDEKSQEWYQPQQ